MDQTFFFYDLETSGLNPRMDRIMQFAGQRTDMNLEPIGEPFNVLVKLNDDTLPSPEATFVTGITPQMTQQDGLTEAEFARMLIDEVFTPGTITVGFNNIRFDDEFIRALFWRTFQDPYEWAYSNGRSRWDILDVVRMTRALRPDGIEWPVIDGVASNRLELLSSANGLEHTKAHDALSDVEALISVTKLIKASQPSLYGYLLKMRLKNEIKQLVNLDNKRPFVYVSGRYSAEWNKATVAFPLTSGKNGNVVVYDLRHDPQQFMDLSARELEARMNAPWETRKKDDFIAIPVKELQYNRSPAVSPIGVLEQEEGWKRIGISKENVEKHMNTLLSDPGFAERVRSAIEKRPEFPKMKDVEAKLYDGFLQDRDRLRVEAVRNASENDLADFSPDFTDERLPDLLLHYKARNYSRSLSEEESMKWEEWRAEHVSAQLMSFSSSLNKLATQDISDDKRFLLQELQLWAESIVPVEY